MKRKVPTLPACQVCLEACHPPIVQCNNGHPTCPRCKYKLRDDLCPTCRARGSHRCLPLEHFVEENCDISLSCHHPGCEETVPFSQYIQHTRSCRHKLVKCLCEQWVYPSEFKHHAESCGSFSDRYDVHGFPGGFILDMVKGESVYMYSVYPWYLFVRWEDESTKVLLYSLKDKAHLTLGVHGPGHNHMKVHVSPTSTLADVFDHTSTSWRCLVNGADQQSMFTFSSKEIYEKTLKTFSIPWKRNIYFNTQWKWAYSENSVAAVLSISF
jgi:hypothetical protein